MDDQKSDTEIMVEFCQEANLPEDHMLSLLLCESVMSKGHQTFRSAIANAKKIVQLCTLLDEKQDAGTYVSSGESYESVRRLIIAKRAQRDMDTHTSNFRAIDSAGSSSSNLPHDIYAKRAATNDGRKQS